MKKRLIACILIFLLILSIMPNIYAATSPYPPEYGSGSSSSDPVQYRRLYTGYLQLKHDGLLPTTAAFSLNINGTTTQSNDDTLQVIYAKVGDTVTIDATSSKASAGHSLDMYDWQITFREYTSSTYVAKQLDKTVFSTKTFTFDAPGTYNFYLNVRDNTPYSMTEGWGNWSYNGVHRAIGINPGPTGGASDNIYGDWYYAQIQVIVQPDAPTASFSITHNGTDVTDNATQKINRTTNNLVVNLVDNSSIKTGSIAKREWKYWNTTSGWVKVPGQGTNDTSITVDSAALGISPDRMGFQLTATSDKGMTANAAHDVYSTYASGIASIIVHYKDDKGSTLAPDDTIKTDLDKPTTIYSIPIANYKADKASDVVTVPSSDPDKTVEYAFTYTYSPSVLPPTVSIDCKDTVIMGNDITIKGSGTDPQNNPINYSWSVSPSSWMQGTLTGTSSTVWFNQVGTVTVTLTGATSGGSDTDTHKISVLPPTPQVLLDSPLSIGINHKLTVDASRSTSGSQRYAIDWTKSVWEISVTDNSQGLSLDDIKTLHPYTITTNSQGKQVMRIVGDYRQIDILSKKQGKINIYSSLTNTAGYTGFANREVALLPDLAPVANLNITKTTLRDPNDNNLAPFELTDTTQSLDGDPIGKRVWLYAFDSDNDGSFMDETWYVLDNGVWQPVTNYGISGSYDSLKYLDIDLINDGNMQNVTLKVDHVGKYMAQLIVREDLTTITIPEFVATTEMQQNSTLEQLGW